MLNFLFVLAVSARQIMLQPNETLTFFEQVKIGDLFKLIYTTNPGVRVSLTDPDGRLMHQSDGSVGSFHTRAARGGKLKVVAVNTKDSLCPFSYKCPDPDKEVIGDLGYITDVDYVSQLSRVFDDFLEYQTEFLKQSQEYEGMVSRTRFWMKLLMGSEFILASVAIYVMHKDLLTMFEKKQRL